MTIDEGRSRKTARNSIAGLVTQVITLGLGFFSRTIFIHSIGVEYLGLNGVFTNVVSLLSLAELGLGTAFAFALYGPLHDGTWGRLSAILALYRRTYRIVAAGMGVIGVAVIPLLPRIVTTKIPLPNLVILYLVFLATSVVSYLFADRVAVVAADQRLYLVRWYGFVFDLARVSLQVWVLLSFHSYLGYLAVQLVVTIATNVVIAQKAGKLYPGAFSPRERLHAEEHAKLWQNVRAMAIYRLSGVLLNGTTNIVISLVVGTIMVGYYSNYMLIVGAAATIVEGLFTSATASVGNLVASSERASLRKAFEDAETIAFLVHATIGICFLTSLDDLIGLWLGAQFRLGWPVVTAISAGFYVYGMLRPVMVFREVCGIFSKAQFALLATALLNIGLAVGLGVALGLPGVLVANPLARLLFQGWFEPLVLLRGHPVMSISGYLWRQVRLATLGLVAAAGSWVLVGSIGGSGVLALAERVGVSLGLCVAVFGLGLARSVSLRRIIRRLGLLFGVLK